MLQWCLFESSFVALAAGDADEARRRVDVAIAAGREVGYPAYAPFFLAHRGWMARLGGELDVALADGRAAVEEAATLDHPWWFAAASGLYAAGLLAAGRTDAAAVVARAGWDSVHGHGAEAYQLLTLAPLAAATGDPALLSSALAQSPPSRRRRPGVGPRRGRLPQRRRALRAAGRDDEAASVVAPLLAATRPDHGAAARRRTRHIPAGRR